MAGMSESNKTSYAEGAQVGGPRSRRKLDDEQVRQIRARWAERVENPITMAELGADYGITKGTVHKIIHRVSYRNVVDASELSDRAAAAHGLRWTDE